MGTVEPQTDGGGGGGGSQGRHGEAGKTDMGAVRTDREMKIGYNNFSPTAGEGDVTYTEVRGIIIVIIIIVIIIIANIIINITVYVL